MRICVNGHVTSVPDAELHWFEGGHFMLEEHAEVATLIMVFLSSRLAHPAQ